jgi:hypothetical protein
MNEVPQMCSSHVTVGLAGAISPDRELHLPPSQPCLGQDIEVARISQQV